MPFSWYGLLLCASGILDPTACCIPTADHAPARNIIRSVKLIQPVGLALGSTPSSDSKPFRKFRLTPSVPLATLDFGHEVAGYPAFDVESITGKVQFEVKYAEEFRALESNFSDGPFPYAVALSNTYRVETFEVTDSGPLKAFLLQGGQRWQSIRLLTGGNITFSSVGFEPSTPVTDIDQMPGAFECDNDSLNSIWELGARAAAVSCVEQGSQRAIWEVDKNGAFVRGMRPGISVKGAFFKDYTLEFDTRIERGGVGWGVAYPIASPYEGIQLNLVGNLPNDTTFVNTNLSLTPPNSILLGYGYSFVNQTSLTSYHLDTFKVPFPVQEKTWYRIKTILSGGQYLIVSLNDTQVFNVSLQGYYIGGSPIPTSGSFGFGGWQDQAGYFRNVVAYDNANGTTLYSNLMTDASQVLDDYGVHENYAPVCLDGPKRDRLVWLGDFYHTVQVVSASTSMFDIAKGTLQFVLDWQTPTGFLPYAPPMGYNPAVASTEFEFGGGGYRAGLDVYSIILVDYQILGLLAFTNYVALHNDLSFANQTWSKWQLQIDAVLAQINSTNGLLSLPSTFLGPADGGSAINCALVQALNMAADVGAAINDTESASKYRTAGSTLAANINKILWNPRLGVYSLSPTSPDDFSIAALSFCISSGTANAAQAAQFVSRLPSLQLGPGYKDSTQVNGSDPTVNISPNTNGFLLGALLSQNSASAANTSLQLLQSLWGSMLNNRQTTTGASWEYVSLTGEPGLGLYTSLSHPWGGAPTYLLIEWMAGLQRANGSDGFGYRNWIVNPYAGVAIGLKRARARVLTAFGGTLEVQWSVYNGSIIDVTVTAPSVTSGVFELGSVKKVLSGTDKYHFTIEMSE